MPEPSAFTTARKTRAAIFFKADAYLTRSLFDLWSNFTFFLNDQEFGDEIQQHDSRLQQGANAQFIRPFTFGENRALLIAGANFQAFQTNVGLYPSVGRNPINKRYFETQNYFESRLRPGDDPAERIHATPATPSA